MGDGYLFSPPKFPRLFANFLHKYMLYLKSDDYIRRNEAEAMEMFYGW